MYCITVGMELKAGTRKKFLDAMPANAGASVRDEPGCVTFDVLEAREEPDSFLLYEIYDSQAAFEDHLQTPVTRPAAWQSATCSNARWYRSRTLSR